LEKVRKSATFDPMEVLELVAERSLGKLVLSRHSGLKSGLRKIDRRTGTRPASKTSAEEKERIAAIIELCFEYKRESDAEERNNILRTLDEIVKNEPIELPTQTLEQWDDHLASDDREYAKLRRRDEARVQRFLKKYFSLKHKAGLKTHAEVGKVAGLGRTQVTVLESGEHMPQQKTLQKLANAFGVDVTELM
jgi:DNA-binding XRE family transcriptional regulator